MPDSQSLLDKLFEHDWEMIQKPHVKSEEELLSIKSELKKWYWTIRDAFKYYSSISSSTGSGTFSLTLNSYTDYLKNSGVYKKETISFAETDTLFLSITKRDKPTTLNPGNSIIRYQFLEIVMKIGLKYSKKKNPGDAIKEFCDEIIRKSLPQGKAEDFRRERYWNVE